MSNDVFVPWNRIVDAASSTNSTGATVPTIFDLVKADLDERDRNGWQRYGRKLLLPGAQKDRLREAYEEAMDLVVYLRGVLAEREAKK
jgi:hypothetical protein